MRLVSPGPESPPSQSGSVLARERELLQAALRARAEERRRDRLLVARAAEAERRRLERDLHDGAQQQLVALALDLRRLAACAGDAAVAAAVQELSDRLAAALGELRELARGVYPAILTTRGLGPALHGLAARAPLPVFVDVAPIERPTGHVEATAYFVVSEALTNVARHARAGRATVAISRHGGDLVVVVADDGTGGADAARGTGLLACASGSTASAGRCPSTVRRGSEPGSWPSFRWRNRGRSAPATRPLPKRRE